MTPAQFWSRLYSNFTEIFKYLILTLIPEISLTIRNTPILLLVFGLIILGIVIKIFTRISDG